VTALERELLGLACRTTSNAAELTPADLGGLRALVGEGAVEYAVVASAFHFINRIADLLHVDPEALPEGLRRFEWLRKGTVLVASRLLRALDLANRRYTRSYEDALASFAGSFARTSQGQGAAARAALRSLEALRGSPQVIESLQLVLDERDQRSSLDRQTLSRVQRVVEASLPKDDGDLEGFHERPSDPVEAFAFVGTRYAVRTTPAMIDRLRATGYDDYGILDLAIAVADANLWARLYRLLGLDARLFLLP
jgi:alkylhydroperoxidase family enzyme